MNAPRPRLKNAVAAFAVAPLAGAVLVAGLAFLFAVISGAGSLLGSLVGMSFIVTAGVGYGAAIVLGIPGFFVLRRFGWVRRAHWVLLCAAIGSGTGTIGPVLEWLVTGRFDDLWPLLGGFAVAGALIGAASGLLFARIISIEPPGVDQVAATFD